MILTAVAFSDTVNLFPTEDTYVWQANPGYNYGCWEDMTVGYIGGWSNVLIKYDLASLTGATINSAIMIIYVWELYGTVPTDEIYVGRNTTFWEEDIVTWNSRPLFSGISLIPAPSQVGYWEVDVTYLVQEFVSGIHPNYGFQIFKNDSDSDSFHMNSRESPSHCPYMYVDYDPMYLEAATFGSIKAMFR
ncbi:MAG: DNRLRE domain-containing protein [Candidatus Fermentibacteraceae bacterium]|nr:DNRLRE domain-containing protein [Candidatus Fermentibacteraceae bacterium]